MVKVECANAYKEVLDILKYVSKEDLNKIPTKKIEMFSKYANYDYDFEYNPEITLKEQNVSDIAQTIIAILFRDYWATSEQREKILKKEKYDMQLLEEYKKEKYNSNIIFNNKFYKHILCFYVFVTTFRKAIYKTSILVHNWYSNNYAYK